MTNASTAQQYDSVTKINKLTLMKRSIFRSTSALAYFALMILPGVVFFQQRNWTVRWTVAEVFPLLGLYAFTLVGLQALTGPNLRWLRPFWPKIFTFHRYQGCLALGLTIAHPLLVVLAYGPVSVLVKHDVVSPELGKYISVGMLAAGLVYLTAVTAIVAWRWQRLTTIWRFIHLTNYAVFILAWIHSWFLGSDVRITVLKYVWLIYLAGWAASLVGRIARTRPPSQAPVDDNPNIPL